MKFTAVNESLPYQSSNVLFQKKINLIKAQLCLKLKEVYILSMYIVIQPKWLNNSNDITCTGHTPSVPIMYVC